MEYNAESPAAPKYIHIAKAMGVNTDGMTVKVSYSDGTSEVFSSGFTTSYSFKKAGMCRVTVTVEGVSAYFDAKVTQRTLEAVEIARKPVKLQYTVGDPLDDSGLVLTAYYSDDTSELVRTGWTLTGNTNTAGNVTVTVRYQEKSATYTITVSESPVVLLQVSKKPDKLLYTVGEKVDLTGLVLTVTRENSQTFQAVWPDAAITWEADLSKAGENVLTVSYGGKRAEIVLTVTDPVPESVSVLHQPARTEYRVGEKLDTTGLVLLAAYPSGAAERITDGYRTEYDFSKPGTVHVKFIKKRLSVVKVKVFH